MTAPHAESGTKVIRFGDYELDQALFQLRCRGEPVPLEPRAYDLLVYLADHRDHVVTKDELLDHVWTDVNVGESSIPRAVSSIRRVFVNGGAPVIETVYGRGYRFVARVEGDDAPLPAPKPLRPGGEAGPPKPLRPPFVGREVEMAFLGRQLCEAEQGRGSLSLVRGEAGIGKTRLLEEFVALARAQGAHVAATRCPRDERAPLLWPWLDLLRGEEDADDAGSVREMLRGAAERSDPDEGGRFPDQFQVFYRLARFWRARAGRGTRVLVIDDLDRADPESLRFLDYLATDLRSVGLMLVGLCRGGRALAGGGSGLGAIRRALAHALRLRGLGPGGVAALVEHARGACDERLAEHLSRLTGGNPLLLQRALSMWHMVPASDAELPPADSWPSLLAACVIEDVPREVIELLGRASVIGEAFRLDLLEPVAGRSSEELSAALETAEAAGLVAREVESWDRYRFVHGLLRSHLYHELGTTERARLHERTGSALEELLGENAELHAEALATHFLEAAPFGSRLKAGHYAALAARHASEAARHRDAVAYLKRGLSALAGVDAAHDRRCEMRVALVDEAAHLAESVAPLEIARSAGARRRNCRAADICDTSCRANDTGTPRDPEPQLSFPAS